MFDLGLLSVVQLRLSTDSKWRWAKSWLCGLLPGRENRTHPRIVAVPSLPIPCTECPRIPPLPTSTHCVVLARAWTSSRPWLSCFVIHVLELTYQRMELMIHISAPTSRKDDDKYRAEALAYRGFEAISTVHLAEIEAHSPGVGCQGVTPGGRRLDRPLSSTKPESPPSYADLSLTQRLRASDGSVGAGGGLVPSGPESLSESTPVSHGPYEVRRTGEPTVPSSSRTPMQRLEALHSLWKERQSLSILKTPRSRDRGQHCPSLSTKGDSQGFIENTQLAIEALETQIISDLGEPSWKISAVDVRPVKRRRLSLHSESGLPPDSPRASVQLSALQSGSGILENIVEHEPGSLSSQLPLKCNLSESNADIVSQPIPRSPSQVITRTAPDCEAVTSGMPPGTSERAATCQDFGATRTSREQAAPSSTGSNAATAVVVHSQIIALHALKGFPLSTVQLPYASSRKSPPGGARRARTHASREDAQTSDSTSMAFNFTGLPYVVVPPLMPTSTEKRRSLPSQISDTLRHLADNPELMSRYRPVHLARSINDLERGYWSVDTSSWSQILQHQFWSELVRYHGAGRLGYLVTLSRQVPEGLDPASGIGAVRLWSFGEVVPHMYLVLYALSNGRVRDVGAQWVSAVDESVLVQMRSSTNPKS